MLPDVTVHRVVRDMKKPGQYIEKHRHAFYHFIYGISGNAHVTVGEAAYSLKTGTLIMVPPKTDHAVYSLDNSSSLSIKFTCDARLKHQIEQFPICVPHLDVFQDKLIKSLFEEAVNRLPGFDELVGLRLCEFLVLLQRSMTGRNSARVAPPLPTGAKSKRIQRGLDYIESNLEEPIAVSKVAAVCGYHKNYFSEVFHRELGYAPNEYIRLRKVERSRELMLYTDLNITQIAERLGFESIHYFSRVFKEITGMPPSEYLNRVRREQGINVVHNSNTPPGEFEIPLKDGAPEADGGSKEGSF